jgi:hypothetical protein
LMYTRTHSYDWIVYTTDSRQTIVTERRGIGYLRMFAEWSGNVH